MPKERIASQSSSVGRDAPGKVNPGISVPVISGTKLGKGVKGRRGTKKTLKLGNGTVSGIMTPPRG